MKNLKSRRVLIGVGVLVVLVAGYYGIRALTGDGNGALKASGTIEATTVNVSPELAGKVQTVQVDEGQSVQAGEVLFQLDPTLLSAQHDAAVAGLQAAKSAAETAQAAYAAAQAQYQQALDAALVQDEGARVADWFPKDPKQFDQPMWYFTRSEQIQVAQGQVEGAQKDLAAAQAKLDELAKSLPEAEFVAAEQRLENARQAYLINKQVNELAHNSVKKDTPVGLFNLTHCGTNQGYKLATAQLTNQVYGCTGDANLSDASQRLYDAAQAELAAAEQAYNQLLGSQAAEQLLDARAQVSVQQERYYTALDQLRSLQTGDQSPQVAAAQAGLEQARTAAQQAQDAVRQAQANVELLEAQLGKLEVKAPLSGVILTRNIEPGEYVAPGAAALTMGQLSDLTITVYVPEDRYGQIHLGQAASVSVDSFPGQAFSGEVTNISDQAEFTPRNVQTVEGRSSTVYAIKLTVTDPQGKLKPGMPADVIFAH